MKIAICGATGRTGSRIMEELLRRGHQVIALVRDPAALPPREGVTAVHDDLADPQRTAEAIRGADAFVCAYAPPPSDTEELVRVTARLVEATTLSKVPRFLMVGGAGPLEVAPGVTLIDSGKLPPEWLPIATAHAHALDLLRRSAISWTSLAPSAYFDPGERTGHFRLDTDHLLVQSDGNSSISMEDYAIAMADEIEHPKYEKKRFTVGY